MWNLAAPPGFQGLDPHKPMTMYQRQLPHWRQDGATYFVTFRLDDSLPQCKLHELRRCKEHWEFHHPPPRTKSMLDAFARDYLQRVERWLDQGMGDCVLRDPSLAALVTASMHHFDGTRYELGCYAVMPNHVHAVVRPLSPDGHPLEDIVGSWKSYCARRINATLGRTGELWQEESYDRIIRDEEHLWRVLQYIGANPQRAFLAFGEYSLWVSPAWTSSDGDLSCRNLNTARHS